MLNLKSQHDDHIERTDLEIYLRPQWGWKSYISFGLALIIYWAIFLDLEIDLTGLLKDSTKYLLDVLTRMVPPDFSEFEVLLFSMLETVEIAMMGTLLAIILSIPLAIFSARNITTNYFVYSVCKSVTIFFRALPEFIVAMILVIAIGFGPMPILALGLAHYGLFGKVLCRSNRAY